MENHAEALALLDFLKTAPTPWHAVDGIARMLDAAGYTALREADPWSLAPGGRYYVTRNLSSVIAFTLPEDAPEGFLIAAAHSDSPTFKIKAVPELTAVGRYTQLDTEPYGGMIMSSWLDRPLSVAGRLLVRGEGRLETRLVRCEQDLCVIPNVAIHMNREVNSGYAWKANVDLMPLWGSEQAGGSFLRTVAEAAGVDPERIAGHDLYLYNRVPGCVWGVEGAYLSAGRLDDLECAWTAARAFAGAAAPGHVNVLCVFDNEEVGSSTRQGADGSFLLDVLTRIADAEGGSARLPRMLAGSVMVSADNAHAVHPNHPEYSDPVNRVWMNGGVVIKHNARQKYTTDAVTCGLFSEICRGAGVPVQHFANRSDLPGGSTLGNLSGRHVSIPAVDIGLAQLSMHSAWETAGTADVPLMIRALRAFWETPLVPDGDGNYRIG